MASTQARKTVLVTGANGYIGSSVCRAFVRAGWRVFGHVRRLESAQSLSANEVIPLVGSIDLKDLAATTASTGKGLIQDYPFSEALLDHSRTVDVIVGCSGQWPDYASHYHGVIRFFRAIAALSNANGVKPLVLWSSGCKDYGAGDLHGTPGLKPHTEDSPIVTEGFLAPRTSHSMRVFEHSDMFDATLLRPTNVYGYSSSFYGLCFDLLGDIAGGSYTTESHNTTTIQLSLEGRSIMHAMHVDDCAKAYLALAEHSARDAVAGQCFNISSSSYETCESIINALAREYGIREDIAFMGEDKDTPADLANLFGFSQWVDSSKLRRLTGWYERRASFVENISVYRRAYESAKGTSGGIATRLQSTSFK
ncbi:hypothetical protein Micbo1qcDRAFT_5144 [Microdochium bolleyi]|uniref:NAD-dependent epimerase/dehydratase domain-containing protein n=1 Tax=Microdochium bolleyi TaxID=196109 RepID=A0A136JIT3_9PEZI|nr:hypothetical protein Micbo1qcDRAFT_5144 [Microdochium bolleyi]